MIIKKINLIILIIIFAIYEDLIRKFVPGHTPLIFLIKDFLLIIVYTVFLFELALRKKKILKLPILIPIVLLFSYELISALWVNNFNLLVFFSGLKIDFFYVLLIFIVPTLVKYKVFFSKIFFLSKYSLLLLFALQIFEFFFPNISSSLSLYSLSEDYERVFHSGHSTDIPGGFIRYYKTFYFSSAKFSDMVIHLYLLFIISCFMLNKIRSNEIIFFTGILLIMVLLCGKRIFIIILPIIMLSLVFPLSFYKKEIMDFSNLLYITFQKLKRYLVYSFFMFGLISFYLYQYNQNFSYLIDFIYQAINEGIFERYFLYTNSNYLAEIRDLLSQDYLWYGQGVGTNTQGYNLFVPNGTYNDYEMGYLKFINEHGIFGFLLFIYLIFKIFIFDINSIKLNKIINHKIIAIMIFAYHFTIFIRYFNGHSFFGSTQTIFFFWFLMGIQCYLFKNVYYEKK